MKQRKQNKLSAVERLSNATQLPLDMAGCNPYIRMCFNREIIIEDAGKLLHYDEESIKVVQRRKTVVIKGNGLKISYLSNGDLRVVGIISSVGFE